MKLTVISHFWNEVFLLHHWLRHHYALADHGVLIDYHSTGSPLGIIRDLAPRWEVRCSRKVFFDACEVNKEIMEIEKEFSGWKIVLNTTEFLLCADVSLWLRWMKKYRPDVQGLWPFDFVMVDTLDDRENTVTIAPLYFPKHWSYHSGGSRNRLLHRFPESRYEIGRHTSPLVAKVPDDSLFFLWFGWSPMRYLLSRKLQIQERIPPQNRAQGLGRDHLINSEEIEAANRQEASKAYNLMESTRFIGD